MKVFGNLTLKRVVLLSMVLISFTACKKDQDDRLEENIEEIEQYIADNNLEDLGVIKKTGSGLHYIVTKEGDGNFPASNSTVTVKYKGYLTNNEVFDANPNYTSSLENLIQGWQEGIPKLSKGGAGLLLIPSKLGYGANGAGSIPPYAVLIFEIDLLDFQL